MSRTIGATPIAIVAGAVIIAVAVFLGLRGRPAPAAPIAATPSAAASSASSAPGSTSAGGPAPPPVQPGVSTANPAALTLAGAASPHDKSVEADVVAALEKQRPGLVESCWKPSDASASGVAPATFEIDVSFDEAGHEVAKGISPRGKVNPELTSCLNMRSPSLAIPPRGVRTRARVPFTLP
jgi:hypothetical protein